MIFLPIFYSCDLIRPSALVNSLLSLLSITFFWFIIFLIYLKCVHFGKLKSVIATVRNRNYETVTITKSRNFRNRRNRNPALARIHHDC